MRSSDLVTLPLATLATLLTVVACGPAKDYVPITQAAMSPLSRAIQECKSTVSSSRTVNVGKTVGHEPRVKVCSLSSMADDNAIAKAVYTLNEEPVRYTIQKSTSKEGGSDVLSISLKVGLLFDPQDISEENRKAVGAVLYNVCAPQIKKIFKRSMRSGGIDLDSEFDTTYGTASTDQSKNESFHQVLELGAVSGADIAYKMFPFPDGAKLYPFGKANDKARCKTAGRGVDKVNCASEALIAANLPFCAQLTKLTAIYLGLSDEKLEQKRCGPKEKSDDAPRVSQFLRDADEMDASKFFQTAKLSQKEVASIFAPACPSFGKL